MLSQRISPDHLEDKFKHRQTIVSSFHKRTRSLLVFFMFTFLFAGLTFDFKQDSTRSDENLVRCLMVFEMRINFRLDCYFSSSIHCFLFSLPLSLSLVVMLSTSHSYYLFTTSLYNDPPMSLCLRFINIAFYLFISLIGCVCVCACGQNSDMTASSVSLLNCVITWFF